MSIPRLDVVVFGATGVTGGNALPYLARRATELGMTWGVAGRDPQRLMQVTSHLPAGHTRPEVIEADLDDEESLDDLARSARVVINAVGPYRRSAEPVITACIRAGCDYLDLTGEMDVVAEMIRRHHGSAQDAGVRIVQAAGYEALPFDLAVALAAAGAAARGARLTGVDVVTSFALPPGVPRPSDGISGGTFASTVDAISSGGLDTLMDPACLIMDRAEAARVRRASPVGLLPRIAGTAVLIPLVPSPFVNPPVVHRSQSLLRGEGAGAVDSFRYREGMSLGEGLLTLPLRLAAAMPIGAAGLSVKVLSRLTPAPVRRAAAAALDAVGPDAGSGPREDRLEGWRWRLEVVASADDGSTHHVVVDADGHPGYLATSRMIAEAALLLADPDAALPARTGHLTPATALGTAELARFGLAGVRFRAT